MFLSELTPECLTAFSWYEDWTAAIKSGDREKISEQLQVPRDLLQKAKARSEQLAIGLKPVVDQLADRLLLNEPQDIKGANKLLTDFLQWADEVLEKDPVLNLANDWFSERSTDTVTPVSGDVRIKFTRIHVPFVQQQNDEESILSAFVSTYYFLGQMIDTDDPEGIREAKKLVINFYSKVGERTGNTALVETEKLMAEFLQTFKATLRRQWGVWANARSTWYCIMQQTIR